MSEIDPATPDIHHELSIDGDRDRSSKIGA
jgi:hypothetical protein